MGAFSLERYAATIPSCGHVRHFTMRLRHGAQSLPAFGENATARSGLTIALDPACQPRKYRSSLLRLLSRNSALTSTPSQLSLD